MRILLILILAALSGWALYDRNDLKQQMTLALDKLKQTQSEVEASNKRAESASAELGKLASEHNALLARLENEKTQHLAALTDAERRAAEVKAAAAQAEAERLAQRTWLQQQIERRGDPLARPATPSTGTATVRRTYPNYYYSYPYTSK